MCDGERKTQCSRTASSIAHCSDCHTSHAAPLSVPARAFHLYTSLLLAFSLFLSPHETPGRTQLGHMGLPSSRLGRSVSMVPEKFRSGKEVEVGYQSKSSILFSSQCVYTYSIPPGRGTGPHLLAHFDSACERDIVFASL